MKINMAIAIASILLIVGLLNIGVFVNVIPSFCPDINTYDTFTDVEKWFLSIFIISVGLCWFLSRNLDTMHTINQCGTKLFGCTSTESGYIATKWICVFFFPILPVTSYEVFAEDNYSNEMSTRYIMKKLDKLFWTQIFQTALKGFLSLVGVVIFLTILFNLNCFN